MPRTVFTSRLAFSIPRKGRFEFSKKPRIRGAGISPRSVSHPLLSKWSDSSSTRAAVLEQLEPTKVFLSSNSAEALIEKMTNWCMSIPSPLPQANQRLTNGGRRGERAGH